MPAGVRVAEDHSARVVVQRALDHLAWIDAGLLQGAGEQFFCRDDTHLRVEEHDDVARGQVVATLGGLNPLGAGVAAVFIGLIDTGSQSVSRALGVPVYLGDVILATLLLVTLAMLASTVRCRAWSKGR